MIIFWLEMSSLVCRDVTVHFVTLFGLCPTKLCWGDDKRGHAGVPLKTKLYIKSKCIHCNDKSHYSRFLSPLRVPPPRLVLLFGTSPASEGDLGGPSAYLNSAESDYIHPNVRSVLGDKQWRWAPRSFSRTESTNPKAIYNLQLWWLHLQ